MKEKRLKVKTKVLAIILLSGLLVFLGISYGFWAITRTQNNDNAAGTGCLDLSFIEANAINLTSVFPISDEDGMQTSPYTFTLTNTCSMSLEYHINLEVLTGTTLASEFLKLGLNDQISLLTDNSATDTTIVNATSSYNIGTGTLVEDESVTFDLRIWMDKDTPFSEGQSKMFASKISIAAIPTTDIDYIPIYTANDFYNIRNNLNASYKLINDIDLSECTVVAGCGENWEVIGSNANFSSINLDGNNKTINNLVINNENTYQALFHTIYNATIKDLTINDVNITASHHASTLAARAYDSTISNVHSSGLITLTNTDVQNGYAGGIVAALRLYGDGMDPQLSVIVNSSSAVDILAPNSTIVGGITGVIAGGIIRNSYSTGNIECNLGCGGLIGTIGSDREMLLEESYSVANVKTTASGVGGLIGTATSPTTSGVRNIQNNYFAGSITTIAATSTNGGLIGGINSSGDPFVLNQTNNYVRADYTNVVGIYSNGFIGSTGGYPYSYTGNYIDNEYGTFTRVATTPEEQSLITPQNSSAFKTTTAFPGWDTNIWEFSNSCWPILKNTGGNQRQLLGCE